MKTIAQILFFIIISVSAAYSQNVIFKSITTQEGLSSNDVNCLLQDKLGFIWIGTDNGLNRYDGAEFKVFRNYQNNANSISDNGIWTLYEDRSGNIWIGTKGGVLNKYSPKLDKFEGIILNKNKYSENGITSIIEDKQGFLWTGTYSQGLFRYDPTIGKIKNWKYDPTTKNGLSNNYITSLLQDEDGSIWISTYNGLNRLNPNKLSNGFDVFITNDSNPNTISNNLVWRVEQSKFNKNLLWICTSNGLCKYDLDKNIINRVTVKATVPSQFSSSFASVVEQNVYGKNILWVATYSGLFRIDLSDNASEQFVSDKNNSNGLLGNKIDQLMIDRSGVLWIAADKGLNYHSLKSQKFNNLFSKNINEPVYQELSNSDIKGIINGGYNQFYIASSDALFSLKVNSGSSELKKFNELNNLNLWSIEIGINKDLWIGTYGNGLIHFDLATSKTRFVKIESPTFKTSAFKFIKALHISKNGLLWIGFWGGGFASLDTKTEKYNIWINDDRNERSLSFNDVWTLHEDKFGRLWIGTNGGGLNLFLPDNNGEFKNWKFDNDNKNSIINNSILTINEIPSGNENETILLVGTENGLSKVTIKNNNSDIFNVDLHFNNLINAEGLIDKSLSGILSDENGFLWISSNSGLIRFNPTDGSSHIFGNADGINSNIFNSDAYSKSESGLMIFGTVKGPVIFNPAEIKLSEYKPNIILTDFQVFNKSIVPGEDSQLKTFIADTKEIILTYDQNVITFKFSSLDFNSSEHIQFLYKLEGFDKDWIYSGKRRYAAYTNLSSGTYYFKIKATNSDGVWSDRLKSIKVIINAPWWKTGWAYSLYLLIIFLGLVGIRRFELKLIKLRNELKMREYESKKHRDIENVKSRFFANLSHEFRTPLMLIKGPLEQLKDGQVKGDPQHYYDLIYRNTENLHTLIDQLLELTQLEAETILIKAQKENLIILLRGIFYSFESIANQKNISIEFISDEKSIYAWVDRDKLEKIINNILSNAFKFTPAGGIISLTVQNIKSGSEEFAKIKISDSGIGIPKDKIDRIFDRFYQVDDSSGRAYGGSGIGLSLVKEFVDLHKWEINIESEIAKGTTFILKIPLGESYLSDEQKIKEEYNYNNILDYRTKKANNHNSITVLNDSVEDLNISDDEQVFPNGSTNKNPSILVVEDSSDVREYIFSLFHNDYNIIQAENAEVGISKASEQMPDLILSDVMMPGMDGMEFCKQIKTNFQTSHIPVILLTAKVSFENKIEGLETGADDYVTKPFNFKELSVRIKNLLAQRKRLKDRFSKEIKIQPEAVTVNSVDKEFLERALNIAENNIYNSDFDSEFFAKEMFVSRSQLHRKMIAITGQAPGEFIRIYRLKKAAQLLLEKKLSVTQIALEVGFNSPSHFTKAFHQYFNCLPSVFVVQK